MTKFIKKPIVIEAIQFCDTKEGIAEILRFVPNIGLQNGVPIIKTLEGTMSVSPGDWIICGVKGEFYPCKPDIFKATYEIVEPSL